MISTRLPEILYDADGVRALDHAAIKSHGIPGDVLMERASAAVWNIISERWPHARRIAVVCGLGNNAGDGYVVARLARDAGCMSQILQLGDRAKLSGEALNAYQLMLEQDIPVAEFEAGLLNEADLIVDAVFGSGLDREVTGPWRDAINAMNEADLPVVSVDIPSGLNTSTGQVMGVAVKAHTTITFLGMKQGLLTGDAADYCGALVFDDLAVPEAVYGAVQSTARRLEFATVKTQLKPRRATSHKGDNGHVLIIGGSPGFGGAACLAGEAAARAGAGLVSLAYHPNTTHLPARPELMCHAVADERALSPLLERANVVAIGPGLGASGWGQRLLERLLTWEPPLLEADMPVLLDADALTLLARRNRHHDRWILTPHPGEAARLLGVTSRAIQADRFAAVRKIRSRFGGVCVLKGAGTLIADGEAPLGLCAEGNPGMGSGGMGDVLTGIIAALMAQGLEHGYAARLGVCIHARAGDLAIDAGERGLLAGDLMAPIQRLVN